MDYLAINFAYQMTATWENGRLEGILISNSKEHAFVGLIGKQIGLTVERFIWQKFHRQVITSVANDTICLTLSGLTQAPAQSIAGGIGGTGMNFGFFLTDRHLVNSESGNFN